jgi:unsaturated rhamnogalacturonyl hydrolase
VEFKGKESIVSRLEQQIDAFNAFQREDGLFGTVLDIPEQTPEFSASCGIAYGIMRAIQMGLSRQENRVVFDRLIKIASKYVDSVGEAIYVSTGTPVMPSKEAYLYIRYETTLYGQTLAILLFSIDG